MDTVYVFQRLHHGVHIKRLLYFVGISSVVLVLPYLFIYHNGIYFSIFPHTNEGFVSLTNDSKAFSNNSELVESYMIHDDNSDRGDALPDDDRSHVNIETEDRTLYRGPTFEGPKHVNSHMVAETGPCIVTVNISTVDGSVEQTGRSITNFHGGSSAEASSCNPKENVSKESGFPPLASIDSGKSDSTNLSLIHSNEVKYVSVFSQEGSLSSNDNSVMDRIPASGKKAEKSISISQMNLLLNMSVAMKSKKPRWSSRRDQELQHAKFQIEKAPIQRNISEVHASLFRNYSRFKRSYELMEDTLKVYVYRDGEKPIFHLPYMRGIYASEGWFMKLMERNKQFAVRDPKKAHLFYLAFSSVKLRNAVNGSSLFSQKDMQNYLKNYVDMVAAKYRFWNKSGGTDHFVVACHDWAPRFTRNILGSCIRVLCNSNIARGFKIGKDVSLPVTYIRSSENPLKDIGGNPPSQRPILAFFAGGMHGYVRPMLLQYWHNKSPDMKIFGPMPRDIEGKEKYREYMKSSKYCICAKGYEVHTPRVIESIYYECVPVIISDNYVPPFFEVFDWQAFALFVPEDDIPNLRDILLSISENRYIMMQRRLKLVQPYFLWHKVPEKYDLFHMILHSVWYNRVFQVSS